MQDSNQAFLKSLADKLRERSEDKKLIDPVTWIEKYFYVPEPRDPITGEPLPSGPIILTEHQKLIIRETLSKKPDGMFKYVTILYSAPKKSGKTAIAAAVSMYLAETHTNMGHIYCLANDGKGAEDRQFGAIRKCITLHKKLGGPLAHLKITANSLRYDNHTEHEAIPCDPSGEAGAEPDFTFWSEMWGFSEKQKHKERLWTELTLPPTKYGRSLRWVESYAGFQGESRILENLYNMGVHDGVPHPILNTELGLPVYVNEDAQLFCYWDHEARMPWQDDAYYKAEAKALDPQEFARVHRNEWQRPVTKYLEDVWWKNCGDSTLTPIEEVQIPPFFYADNELLRSNEEWTAQREEVDKIREQLAEMTLEAVHTRRLTEMEALRQKKRLLQPTVMAIDASTDFDASATVLVTRHPAYPETHVAVRRTSVFYPPINLVHMIERTIREWYLKYNLVWIAYDPYQMVHLRQTLEDQLDVPFFSFNQGTGRALSDKKLLDMVVAQQVLYNPDEAVTPGIKELSQHLKNAGKKQAGQTGLRIVKESRAPNDAAVALSMAVTECMRLILS